MITKQDVENAQEAWGQGVVKIGELKPERVDCESYTKRFISELYNFTDNTVLFKPTKAAFKQFRLSEEGALSYFIGGNENYPEDSGFAIQPWTKVRFENAAFIFDDNRAVAMGNYFFTDLDGDETKVEYTFGYTKTADGSLKIDLHHSSLPFTPNVNT